MIVGGHVMIQSKNDAADKAFFRDVLKLDSVDAGGGFLLFALPPSEFAVHEADENGGHTFYLMCEDMGDFLAAMDAAGVPATEPANRGWGTMTTLTLPGGGDLHVYQPHHARPHKAAAKKKAKRVKKVAKKAVAKKSARKAAKKAKKAAKKKAKK